MRINFKNKLKNCSYMFSGCINMKSINLSSLDFSQTTNMSYMFTRCYYLEEIIFENINTEKVTDMSYIFNRCSNLKKIKFPSSFFIILYFIYFSIKKILPIFSTTNGSLHLPFSILRKHCFAQCSI